MTRFHFMRTGLLVAAVMVLTSTGARAQESSANGDQEVSLLSSVVIVSVEEVGKPLQNLPARSNSLAPILSLPSSSLTRSIAQLQPTRLKNDRKTKLIIVGIVAAAIAIWLIYELHHLGDFSQGRFASRVTDMCLASTSSPV